MTEKLSDTDQGWHDPDDAPELTDEMLDMAEFSIGGRVIRRATGVLTATGMRRITPPAINISAATVPRGLVRVYARMGEGEKAMAKSGTTSPKAAKAASKVLKSGSTGKDSKTAAGSALSQKPDKKKKS